MISIVRNFFPLRILISPRNEVQIGRFLIPWNQFEVFFLKIPFSPISTINFSSNLIKFEDYVKKLLNSLWIRPVFTIIPLNSIHFHQIGKFGIIFDAIPREIDDLTVSSRHFPNWRFLSVFFVCSVLSLVSLKSKFYPPHLFSLLAIPFIHLKVKEQFEDNPDLSVSSKASTSCLIPGNHNLNL